MFGYWAQAYVSLNKYGFIDACLVAAGSTTPAGGVNGHTGLAPVLGQGSVNVRLSRRVVDGERVGRVTKTLRRAHQMGRLLVTRKNVVRPVTCVDCGAIRDCATLLVPHGHDTPRTGSLVTAGVVVDPKHSDAMTPDEFCETGHVGGGLLVLRDANGLGDRATLIRDLLDLGLDIVDLGGDLLLGPVRVTRGQLGGGANGVEGEGGGGGTRGHGHREK